MALRLLRIALCLTLAGCASPAVWKVDSLRIGNGALDCAKLLYVNPKSASPLKFEIVRIGGDTYAYLHLIQYHLSDSSVAVILQCDGEIYEETAFVLEGKMKIRLSGEITKKIVANLLEGKPVKIAVDGFEEILTTESFTPLYQKLVKNEGFLQNILKGPQEWINLSN